MTRTDLPTATRLRQVIHRPQHVRSFELTSLRWLRALLRWRPLQFTLIVVTLAFFVLAILASLFGTPVGSRNFGIIFVWIVWWALLILVLVPFGGRLWCAMCPIPAPGEWLQRRALIAPTRWQPFTLGKRWPHRLRSIWVQNLAFLGMALFSVIILTRPLVTGLLLLGLVLLALGFSLMYERRVFCRYLCPVGGFIGLYSMASPIELRVRDPEVCQKHRAKECYLGNERGFGCPWLIFPGSLERNAYCGLCTECLKTCTMDNVAIRLRQPGLDLFVSKGRGLDEAYKAFIMLTCALLYSVVLLGPWGALKDAADMRSFGGWASYALGFVAINLAVVPGLFWVVTWLGRRWAGLEVVPMRRLFTDLAYSLVPLGLMAWVAFSLSFVLVNISYALPVLSDPFGWGWDLFGTRDWPWTPYAPVLIPYLQVPILLIGLISGVYVAWRIAGEHTARPQQALRAALPVSAFLLAATVVLIGLYLG
ncbi:MAG: 4Fe-4S binding protein [Anaerolineae bacterium]|nr:4Fe-4S binding protein [Anaerolineae bacterium]MDW8100708.1 4Fe-4S binding protein [Anaerolineae bacterium]